MAEKDQADRAVEKATKETEEEEGIDAEEVLLAITIAAIEDPDDFDAETIYSILEATGFGEVWEAAQVAVEAEEDEDEAVDDVEESDMGDSSENGVRE